MPRATAIGFQAVTYFIDLTWPVKGTVPSQASAGAMGSIANPWGQDDNTWATFVGSFSGGGSSACRTTGGVWAFVTERVGGGVGNSGIGQRINGWRPALNPATAPTPDDAEHRIAWFRVWCLVDAAETQSSVADSLGVQFLPDDGLAFSSATWPVAASGGFGLFKRAGNDGWRYASYSAAPALLEAINLPSTAGWHFADFIFRQARFNDASTPWLTFRWDGVAQFNERAFGHASLPTPQSMRANAHGWALLHALFPNAAGRMSTRIRMRVGRFHADGYPQP